MARIIHVEDADEIVTRIGDGFPAFWRIIDGRPVMITYAWAVTGTGRELTTDQQVLAQEGDQK